MFLLGIGLTVASMPLFIVAGRNKRKSILSLKAETIYIGAKINNFNSRS